MRDVEKPGRLQLLHAALERSMRALHRKRWRLQMRARRLSAPVTLRAYLREHHLRQHAPLGLLQ
ncbi:hypothetical protein [Mumia zhuanghuii]|uniref:Uncharacterized protein n=1 Tax=Mumia zhuanghuii TaxID=2585211 RepID=A0A5C4M2Q8_9ACTN|nr:hypothetical protein [Mumia zhuanghuii]TNC26017.1 hypothetical protein FHE65_34780 [Mumia zhuanghuii]